jgi:P4 family phage/plasmid primase-like protien
MSNNSTLSLSEFLYKYKYDKSSSDVITHTRIGNKSEGIYGGSYTILDDNIKTLHNHMVDVVVKNKNEYLTEKQMDIGPIAIDLDFRYSKNVSTRQHTIDDITSLLCMYSEIFKKIFSFKNNDKINAFVFEKPNVNMCEKETKDGIHLIFGINCSTNVQKYVRIEAMKVFAGSECPMDIPITNTWDDVYDLGISNRTTNWQLFGCRKPDNEAYKLTRHFKLIYDDNDSEFSFEEEDVNKFNYKKNYHLLSVQNNTNPVFEINEEVKHIIDNVKKERKKRTMKPRKLKLLSSELDLSLISDQEQLENAFAELSENLKPNEYNIKEAHEYTMILPESYFGAGSYNKWFQVGCALKNTDPRLFITWMIFSSQSSEFDFCDIPKYYDMWKQMSVGEGNLSDRSIIYWARNDAPKNDFTAVHQGTIDYFVEQTFPKATDFDLAMVLYQMYKDKFVCVNTKSNIWYKFENHRWVPADVCDLAILISKEMTQLYVHKTTKSLNEISEINEKDDTQQWNLLRSRAALFSQTGLSLKDSTHKTKIMHESKAIFKDDKFYEKLDANPMLLHFTNGVFDFNENCFRPGKPEDYISLSTKINYIPLGEDNKKVIVKPYNIETGEKAITMDETLTQIDDFMAKLFPNESLRKYMWEHLASTLLGSTKNQTFNIYTGAGSNGKSMLVDLMTKCLGELKGTVPITLITQKRTSIGSASPELAKLKGKRLAVMQEPQKKEKINEGILKELTGGDIIQGRALYQDSVEFLPQFKLAVCTNSLFDITANDNGTWRRIRVCDFVSYFTDNPRDDDPEQPHQFKKDKNLDTYFDIWKYAFMARLISIAQKTLGDVTDCDVVMATSNKYREGQDCFLGFSKEKIERCVDTERAKIKKGEVLEVFKQWFSENYGGKPPQGKELYEFMDKTFGKAPKSKGWSNVRIIYDNDDEQELNI